MPTTTSREADLVRLLREGNADGTGKLFEVFYRELHAMAQRRLMRERKDHTLAATSLVHETFLRLHRARLEPADRSAFLRLAATVMRRVLVDSARRRQRRREMEAAARTDASTAHAADDARLLRLDEALHRLGELDAGLLATAELRFLVGLDVNETAAELGRSPASVKRDWRAARAFLQKEMQRHDD